MITRVVLAKLSPTMEEGTILKWTRNEGDAVKVGDVLAEIETDKANMEMEALGAGILRKIFVPAGGKAPVGWLIGVIADKDEDISSLAPTSAPPIPAAAATPASTPPPTPPAAPAPPSPTASATPAPLSSGGPGTAPVDLAVSQAPPGAPASRTADTGRVKASPLARNMATQQRIPIAEVSGSGPGGRVIKRDIEAYRPSGARAAVAAPALRPGQAIPLSAMRKTIARRLSESFFTAPHFYVTVEIAMDASVALREQLLRGENVKVSFNDLVIKACAKALTRFPMVNASWDQDKIVTYAEVHVGVAVSLPDGLLTPVVRNADRKSVLEISQEMKDLAARARERKLRPEEFSGSTFTVSNLGMYDVTAFTAIINPPESAILAVGAIRRVPVAEGDQVRVGQRMLVTLSCDHRVVDGAMGAQFLAEVRRLLENPATLFL